MHRLIGKIEVMKNGVTIYKCNTLSEANEFINKQNDRTRERYCIVDYR